MHGAWGVWADPCALVSCPRVRHTLFAPRVIQPSPGVLVHPRIVGPAHRGAYAHAPTRTACGTTAIGRPPLDARQGMGFRARVCEPMHPCPQRNIVHLDSRGSRGIGPSQDRTHTPFNALRKGCDRCCTDGWEHVASWGHNGLYNRSRVYRSMQTFRSGRTKHPPPRRNRRLRMPSNAYTRGCDGCCMHDAL